MRLILILCDYFIVDTFHTDHDWQTSLKENYETLEELLTVRIVIAFMKENIDPKHLQALDAMSEDWKKIEYLVKEILIPGSRELFELFAKVCGGLFEESLSRFFSHFHIIALNNYPII